MASDDSNSSRSYKGPILNLYCFFGVAKATDALIVLDIFGGKNPDGVYDFDASAVYPTVFLNKNFQPAVKL